MKAYSKTNGYKTSFIWLMATVCAIVIFIVVPAFASVPGVPTIGPASAGNARATVTFKAPASDGGSAITGYDVISNPADGVDSNAGSTETIHTVTGLINGTRYTFTVTATNIDGTSTPSGASNNTTPRLYAPATGTINNLVVFVRFSDQPEFTKPFSYYDGLFNNAANSLKNFYLENSYNTLTVNSTFYPSPNAGSVISYQDPYPTSYYQPYNASTNPGGYTGAQGSARETALVTNALNAINAQIPGGLNLDGDNDGYIDHITFEVYSTDLNPLPVMFYSRATYDTSDGIVINGKHVGSYTWVTASQDFTATYLAATEIHEMGHSLGYPDLRGNSGRTPVGDWDVMSMSKPVHSGAYLKNRFTNWITNIPEITTYGAYSLNDITQSTNNSYKIKLPNTNNEFLILEYRKAAGPFESNLPGSGLCITRVNEAAGFWGNLGGPPFFLYYFRPDGTVLNDGGASNSFACLNAESGRTQFNDFSNPACFLTDGSPCGISIYNIGTTTGSSITFTVGDPASTVVTRQIRGYLYNGGNRVSGATVTLSGDATGVATTDSLGRYLFTVNNGGNYTVTPTKANLTFSPISQNFTNVISDTIQNFSATNNTNTISGTITSNGTPLSGVTVSCSGGNYPSPVITDATGIYSFLVYEGGDYDVRAAKSNYFFSPNSKIFTNVTADQVQDFTTWTSTLNLSGTITSNGNPLGGVNVSCPGANTATPITTDVSGAYTFAVTVGNGSGYTVTPSSSLYTFSPVSRIYNGLVSNQVQNFTATLLPTSSTALVSSTNPGILGLDVTFTATVTGSTPTGVVTFNDGGTALCSAVPLSNGQAQCSTVSLGVGGHSIMAVYSGDGANVGSTSPPLAQSVDFALPTVTIFTLPTASNSLVFPVTIAVPNNADISQWCIVQGIASDLCAWQAYPSVPASFTLPPGSADGAYTLTAFAKNANGDISPPVSRTIVIDTIPPGSTAGPYVVDGGGQTVFDRTTHLEWQQADDGTQYSWDDADAYCQGLFLDGKDDWYLPSNDELNSIVDGSRINPAINAVFSARSSGYWSATTYADYPAGAYFVTFFSGDTGWENRTVNSYVRCVRAGLFYPLIISKTGTGTGSVTSNIPGIECGLNCTGEYPQDASVTLAATPAAGSSFTGWSGNADCEDGNVTMTVATACTAIFSLNSFTLTYTAEANGYISGTTPQTVSYGASGTAVTAIPAANYSFIKWNDNSITNPRTDTNVITDISVTATFGKKFSWPLFLPAMNNRPR